MGTRLHIAASGSDRTGAIAAIESAFAAVRRTDDLLSTWRDDSEIARLNHAPAGHAVALSAPLYRLLREAGRWSHATGGAFDPAIGALVDAWDLRGQGHIPSDAELAVARGRSGSARFRFADARRTVTRDSAGAWLDTGGFGKGAALAAAGRALRARGIASALLNFGGQVLVIGGDSAGRDWSVPVADPAHREQPAAWLRLRDRSASTSSQSERFVDVAGRRLGHLLDPRSGRPVPAWGSVTVVAADPLVADILSTALFVLGPTEALAWARRHPEVGVLLLEPAKHGVRARWSAGLDPYLVQDSTHVRGG